MLIILRIQVMRDAEEEGESIKWDLRKSSAAFSHCIGLVFKTSLFLEKLYK